jgi:hypothetical protein
MGPYLLDQRAKSKDPDHGGKPLSALTELINKTFSDPTTFDFVNHAGLWVERESEWPARGIHAPDRRIRI